MPSASEPDDSGVQALAPRIRIASAHAAAEIYVVDRAYALVASGAGLLSLDLEPGPYRIRQRIGDTEGVQPVRIPDGCEAIAIMLPVLAVPSPIPLPWTSLSEFDATAPRAFDIGEGNVRVVLRVPVDRGCTLTEAEHARLRMEMARLRLESFDGRQVLTPPAELMVNAAHGCLAFGVQLAPGPYVLVQRLSGTHQVCLPVLVHAGYTMAIFVLSLGEHGEDLPLELSHASVATLRTDQLDRDYEGALLRLEAARKATGAGRPMFGWSLPDSDPASAGFMDNPVAALLDCHQALRARTNEAEAAQAGGGTRPPAGRPQDSVLPDLLARVQRAFGEDGGDAVALTMGVADLTNAPPEHALPEVLAGPPLLRRNWDRLLASKEGDALASRQMPFDFEILSGPTWFLWREAPGVRAAAMTMAVARSGARPVPRADVAMAAGSDPIDAVALNSMLSAGLALVRRLANRVPLMRRSGVSSVLDNVTIEDVEAMLAALMRSPSLGAWLDQAQRMFEAEGRTLQDDAMRRLIVGLRSFLDVTLVNALGAELVARQVLSSLRLPQRRVIALVKRLLRGVVTGLAGPDRLEILKVLHGSLDIAEAWLLAPPRKP